MTPKVFLPFLLLFYGFGFSHEYYYDPTEIPSLCRPGQLCADTLSNGYIRTCFCDQNCHLYGDCCVDSPLFGTKNPPRNFSCVSLPGLANQYKMIADCPKQATVEEDTLCQTSNYEDPVNSMIPITVTFDDNSSLTYRNVYCARCNGESNVEYYLWDTVLKCECRLCKGEEQIQAQPKKTFWDSVKKKWIIDWGERQDECFLVFDPKKKWNLSGSDAGLPESKSPRTCGSERFLEPCPSDWDLSKLTYLCETFTKEYRVVPKRKGPKTCLPCKERKFQCLPYQNKHPTHFVSIAKNSDKQLSPTTSLYSRSFCELFLCNQIWHTKQYNTSNIKHENSEHSPEIQLKSLPVNFLDIIVPTTDSDYDQTTSDPAGEPEPDINIITGYVTLVGLSLSIFFLVVHLCTFALVTDLHNLPGMNLASLCVALLGAYLSFVAGSLLIESSEEVWCYRSAIMCYYFFMAAFVWMFIIAFDVSVVLRASLRRFRVSHGLKWQRFIAYSIIGWGCPILLALTAHFLDQALPDSVDGRFRPDITLETNCWFGSSDSLLVFFIIPLAVIMMLNIGFFTFAACVTSENPSGQRNNLRIYFRLIVLIGLTWITGLLPGTVGQEMPIALNYTFWIIFSILNPLQGFFIFVSFTMTSKVLDALSKRCSRMKRKLKLSKTVSSRQQNSSDTGECYPGSSSSNPPDLNNSGHLSVDSAR